MHAATMCRSLDNELSTSFAAFVSLNVSAAVQLFPMSGAKDDKWLIIDSRNERISKMTNAAQARSSATLEVAMMMTICFCRMESLLSIQPDRFRFYTFEKLAELGADFAPSGPNRTPGRADLDSHTIGAKTDSF